MARADNGDNKVTYYPHADAGQTAGAELNPENMVVGVARFIDVKNAGERTAIERQIVQGYFQAAKSFPRLELVTDRLDEPQTIPEFVTAHPDLHVTVRDSLLRKMDLQHAVQPRTAIVLRS